MAAGALAGAALGLQYGNSVVRAACEKVDASNLCGLAAAPTVPFYMVIGAIVGALVAALTVGAILRRPKA